jgi:PAS domain S-box-containing protein
MTQSTYHPKAVGHSADGVVLLDREARFINMNPVAEHILGVSLSDASGKLMWEAAPAAIGTPFHDAHERVRRGEAALILQNYFSDRRWYKVIATPGKGAIFLTFHDVTEFLLAENERLQSEERFHLLVDGVRDYAIFLLDLNGRVATWNLGAERIEGYRAEEVLGEDFAIFYSPEDVQRGKPRQALEVAVAKGRYEETGWRVRKGGSLFWARVVITALRDARGTPRGFAKVIRDETERRLVEEVEERRLLALESAELGTWEYFPQTGAVICDARCRALFGLPPDAEVSYEILMNRIYSEDRDRVRDAVGQALAPGGDGKYQAEYRTVGVRDGIERWVAGKGRVSFDEERRPSRYVGTVRDITDLRDIEEWRERIMGIFAHDLRSPLSAIVMANQMLSQGAALPEEARKAASNIARSADRMSRMIGQLMDSTRMRFGGKVPFDLQRVDLAAVCRDAVAETLAANPRRSVQCSIRGDCVGLFDAESVSRVLSNLLGNALEHGLPDKPVDILVNGQSATIIVEVHNAGPPIPSDLLPFIFDPFRRGMRDQQAGPVTKSTGLGLGLYITKGLVEGHGGHIDVQSTKENGTTFTVQLPRGLLASADTD